MRRSFFAATSLLVLFCGCPSGGGNDCVDDECLATEEPCVGAACEEPGPGDCGDDDDCLPSGGGSSTGGSTGGQVPGNNMTPTNPTPGTTPSQAASVVGEWVYSGASYPRADGTMAELVIAGDLSLRANGTWEHYRRIGNVGATGSGRYTVAGSRITLKHDDGSSDLVYDFFVGTHIDAATGEPFRALTFNFTDGSGFRYLLVENK